ncbi:vesicle-associated membrane protein 3 isoform X3 [Columba livia]|uniref:vesicle-associated membrane protein 3 isoform X3 n=1 Tax=Columba livia TaxID=8932 RepID=UPI000A3797B6|nr:vesicle-associated membrane protein 3 isoform X1 [Columba livia]
METIHLPWRAPTPHGCRPRAVRQGTRWHCWGKQNPRPPAPTVENHQNSEHCQHNQRYLKTTTRSSTSANIPGSSNVAAGSNRRLQQTQHQVDEVVDIMRVNVDKVLERDQKLSELDDRADALQAGASQFETSAAKLKRKYWWKNCKMWAILIAVVLIIIIIIIVLTVPS